MTDKKFCVDLEVNKYPGGGEATKDDPCPCPSSALSQMGFAYMDGFGSGAVDNGREGPYIGVILPPPAGLGLVKVGDMNPGGRVFTSKTGELGTVGVSP
jgi:hypothetical protein